eukprot:1626880-Amphidinium_carterae.4
MHTHPSQANGTNNPRVSRNKYGPQKERFVLVDVLLNVDVELGLDEDIRNCHGCHWKVHHVVEPVEVAVVVGDKIIVANMTNPAQMIPACRPRTKTIVCIAAGSTFRKR